MGTAGKVIIVIVCFFLALVGFLIKIPAPLRGNDKLLHGAFYFFAAGFFHLLFRRGLILILVLLALFGAFIEYAQQWSNTLTHSRIHGRFDPQDIYANLKGLGIYAVIGICIVLFRGRDEVAPGAERSSL